MASEPVAAPRSFEAPTPEWPLPKALVEAGPEGLFGPGSVTWKINRENLLGAVGGARALILQVGHPLVAAGVGAHSDYRKQPWDRLFRTLDAVTAITFGTPAQAEEAARRVWRVHGHVKGKSPEGAGPFPEGTPYAARNPKLALWVHATLVDTSIVAYDRYVGRLTQSEREGFYEEQKLFGEMFGVPRSMQPDSYAEFQAYFDGVVEDELAVTDTLRDVVDATLVAPPMPRGLKGLSKPAAFGVRIITASMLPELMRKELGLDHGRSAQGLARASQGAARLLLPLLPGVVRDFPQARRADRRVLRNGGGQLSRPVSAT
jgi:uncharacterized protein (DUF2236 family)